jgi:hypothetical protein
MCICIEIVVTVYKYVITSIHQCNNTMINPSWGRCPLIGRWVKKDSQKISDVCFNPEESENLDAYKKNEDRLKRLVLIHVHTGPLKLNIYLL